MTNYVSHKVKLTPGQKQRLKRAVMSSTPIAIKLKHSQLDGPDELLITKNAKNKLLRNKANGKGGVLTLSKSAVGANKKGGSILASLGAIFAPQLIQAGSEVGSDIVGEIFGSGLAEKSTQAQKDKAVQVLSQPHILKKVKEAKTPQQLLKVIEKVEQVGGCGDCQSGDGWKDALKWAGAFLNPIGFITGPAMINYRIAKKISDKKGKGISGSGIKFLG